MPVSSLDTDLRQFFSYSVLSHLDRVVEADVDFTFESGPLYLSCYAEAMQRIAPTDYLESDPELLGFAQVFERFAGLRIPGISRRAAARTAATLYWLAGYSANATVLARALRARGVNTTSLRGMLTLVLARSEELLSALSPAAFPRDASQTAKGESALLTHLSRYLIAGSSRDWQRAEDVRARATSIAAERGQAGEFVAGTLMRAVLLRLQTTSLWGSVSGTASAPRDVWRRYADTQVRLSAPLIDLWPSQRTAIAKGLLDSHSSLVLRMPTSAGKTKMTELAFVNDLFTDDRRCLYLAPFRALVSEVEASLGPALSDMGIAVASLYGGAESNEIEVELSQKARVVIATPEKMAAVLRMSGGHLTDFGTIVLDEGHLLGSRSRGTAYELQLAQLRADIIARTDSGVGSPRIIFLSAVLPNSRTIAEWLGGSEDALAESVWHPTTLRVGILTWPKNSSARLRYVRQPNQPLELDFFVPRVLEIDKWKERNSETRRLRSHQFPDRDSKAEIAAALAFRYAAQGPVIIYAQQPRWADGIARRILARLQLERPIDTNLVTLDNSHTLSDLATYVSLRLGENSIVAAALRVGIGLHHGGVPITIRLAIEHAFRTQGLRLLVATNTISQGVNFPVKTVVLHSLPGGDAPYRDFWNLAGRAGRAMKETDGEVVLLQTGQTSSLTINRFLNRRLMEPARSQILQFVEEILARYPVVSSASVDALLEEEEAADAGDTWRGVVNSIDTHLLTLMVEDLDEVEQGSIETLVANLLATREVADDESIAQREGIVELFEIRRLALRDLVPEVEDRRRYARTGISAAGATALDSEIPTIGAVLLSTPEMTEEAVQVVIATACVAPELKGVNPKIASVIAWTWMRRGSYSDVFLSAPELFPDLDSAVEYVEQTMAYALPWVLNALLRLLEPAGDDIPDDPKKLVVVDSRIPTWAYYLPQFLRYGVHDVDLVWIMSLGIPDPAFALWIRDEFQRAVARRPDSFREVLAWCLDNQEELRTAAVGWPRYFVRLLGEVLERYREVRLVLEST